MPSLFRIIWIAIRIFIRMIGAGLLGYLAAAVVVSPLRWSLRGAGSDLATIIAAAVMVIVAVFSGYGWAIYVYCTYSLAVPACLLEKMKAYASLKRSSFLSKKSRFRIFLVHLLSWIMSAALGFALAKGGELLLKPVHVPFLLIIWGLLSSFLAATLAFPIGTVAISLLYYDLRVR